MVDPKENREAARSLELAPEPGGDGPVTVERRDNGFELDGRYYPLRMRMGHPKDLLLMDRLSDGRAFEIAQAAEDDADDAERYGITFTLCMIATSLRAGNPTWSVERIYDRVMSIEDLDTEVVWIGGESEEQLLPPDGPAATPATSSSSSLDESSSSPTPEAD